MNSSLSKPGTKLAGGNVTLVRTASVKTPTKIAPAPAPYPVTTTITSSSTTQPTSLLIKNATGQVTMATLVQARPASSSTTPISPQKFLLRPSTGSATISSGRVETQNITLQ